MKRKKLFVILGLGLVLAAGLGFSFPFATRGAGLTLHGTVEIQEVRLSSKTGGRIKAVLVSEGDIVQAGQRLVELEAPELEAQRLQLVARIQAATARRDKAVHGARAEEKKLAHAAMRASEQNWRKLEKGYQPEEVEQARADLASATAEYDHARKNYDRERALPARTSSKADYDTIVAALSKMEAKVAGARARLDMLTKGYRAEDIAQAKAEWERARANWELIEAGSRAEDIVEAEAVVLELKAKLQEVEAQLREASITAPERSVVEVVGVRPGDVAAPNQPLVRVLRTTDLWVKAFVPEIKLGQVYLHQSAEITCDTYPGQKFTGEVIYIASTSEFTPRNVQSYDERRHQVFAIKIRVDDPKGVFKSGMAADVWLPIED